MAGASLNEDYLGTISSPGFIDIHIVHETAFKVMPEAADSILQSLVDELGLPAGEVKDIAQSVVSMKVEASGTSTCPTAGFGLFTVRAQSQAITVSFLPTYFFRSGLTVAGTLSRDLVALGAATGDPAVESVTRWLHRILPDLESFNLTLHAVHHLPITASDVVLPVFYAAAYTSVLLLLASLVFQRRDFR